MQAGSADCLVILFHGVAAFGYDLDPLGRVLRRALPSGTVVAPDAPFAFEEGAGRQWYSLEGVTSENRLERIVAARPAFDALVQGLIDREGFAGRLDRVALVGFSQGATVVFDALASDRWQVGAVALLSGRFAIPEPFAPVLVTPALLVHGGADPVVPPQESERAYVFLKSAGAPVEKHILPAVGHMVSPRAARMSATFLSAAFGPGGAMS